MFAFAVAWLWLGESLDFVQIAGAAVVLVGIVLAQTARPGAFADPDLAVATGSVPTITAPVPACRSRRTLNLRLMVPP